MDVGAVEPLGVSSFDGSIHWDLDIIDTEPHLESDAPNYGRFLPTLLGLN